APKVAAQLTLLLDELPAPALETPVARQQLLHLVVREVQLLLHDLGHALPHLLLERVALRRRPAPLLLRVEWVAARAQRQRQAGRAEQHTDPQAHQKPSGGSVSGISTNGSRSVFGSSPTVASTCSSSVSRACNSASVRSDNPPPT